MVLLSESEADMQILLNTVDLWCKRWRVKISKSKTNVVHFRKKRVRKTECKFFLSEFELEIAVPINI